LNGRYEKASLRIKTLKERLKESPFEDIHEEIERGNKLLDDLCDDIEAVENELWFALETV
jgi:glutamine synthetase type III